MDDNVQDDWMALESNPEVMNAYAEKLGLKVSKFKFNDLYDTEEETLKSMSPSTLAALLVFPLDNKNLETAKEEAEKILKDGQEVSENLYFVKQYANNACGTIAIVHATLNAVAERPDLLEDDSILSNLLKLTKNMTPEERATELVNNAQLREEHVEAVNQGETETEDEQEINNPNFTAHHFVCLVPKDNALYELDGCKNFPINHGPTSSATLLLDIMKVFQKFLANSEDEYSFSIVLFQESE